MSIRPLERWGYRAVALVGTLAIMRAPRLILGAPADGLPLEPGRLGMVLVCTVLAFAWAFTWGRLSFRRGDEFHQEASKFSWYWGSLGGFGLATTVFMFLGLGGLHWLQPSLDVGRPFISGLTTGFCLMFAGQLAGYAAVRTWWQVSRR